MSRQVWVRADVRASEVNLDDVVMLMDRGVWQAWTIVEGEAYDAGSATPLDGSDERPWSDTAVLVLHLTRPNLLAVGDLDDRHPSIRQVQHVNRTVRYGADDLVTVQAPAGAFPSVDDGVVWPND